MSDVFTKRKRSQVMSRIRSRGNKDTEVALARILRREGVTGWRRQLALRFAGNQSPITKPQSRITIRPDFVFPKLRVAVFVDGCFWHGCPKHSKPSTWLKKSSMVEGSRQHTSGSPQRGTTTHKKGIGFVSSCDFSWPTKSKLRTGKKFWWQKMLANKARDRFVNRTLRRQDWRVVRVWEHELRQGTRSREEGRRMKVAGKIRQALERR